MKAEARLKKEPGEKNFSCYLRIEDLKCSILGQGSSVKAAIKDMESGWNDMKEELKDEGKEIPELEISYKFDIGSLFNYYDFINVAGVSREVGINPSLMRQYVTGVRNPSQPRKERIVQGIRSLASKMQTVEMY